MLNSLSSVKLWGFEVPISASFLYVLKFSTTGMFVVYFWYIFTLLKLLNSMFFVEFFFYSSREPEIYNIDLCT